MDKICNFIETNDQSSFCHYGQPQFIDDLCVNPYYQKLPSSNSEFSDNKHQTIAYIIHPNKWNNSLPSLLNNLGCHENNFEYGTNSNFVSDPFQSNDFSGLNSSANRSYYNDLCSTDEIISDYPNIVYHQSPVYNAYKEEDVAIEEEIPDCDSIKQRSSNNDLKSRRSRTVFTNNQIELLQTNYRDRRYLTISDRTKLAATLGLTPNQVKIWFQNRRSKDKKSSQNHEIKLNSEQTRPNENVDVRDVADVPISNV